MFLESNKLYLEEMQGKTVDEIPVCNWLVRWHKMRECFYLEKTNAFSMPEKIYGEPPELSARYLNSFHSWDGNLGVLLSGMKGTGKSMLAQKVCNDSGLPVIIIPQAYGGSEFLSFLSKIPQDCVIFMDEFEKIYKENEQQNSLLNILDGKFNSKFLFLLTINEYTQLTQYMLNRPSRIHYLKKYNGLKDDMILEVADDLLEDKTKKDDLLKVCTCLGDTSMDILVSLIKELNLYPEEQPMEAFKQMNLRPSSASYRVTILRNNELSIKDHFNTTNPLMGRVRNEWYADNPHHDPEDIIKGHPKTWLELDFKIVDAEFVVKDGEIRINYRDEDDVDWTLIYIKREMKEFIF